MITKFIASVEVHVAAGLFAREERAVVQLEVAATIAWTQVDSITARLGATKLAIGAFHDYCFGGLDGLRKQQQRTGKVRIGERLNIWYRLDGRGIK